MSPSTPPGPATLLALGDSITRERDSWAEQVAAALGLAPVILAADGAGAADVVATQLPRVGGPHALALVYVGVNDARSLHWDAPGFARDLAGILAAAARAAPRVLVLTIPADLGRPPAGPDAVEAAGLVRAAAARAGADVVELADFGAPGHVEADHVHPTPAGQAEIAARALRVLRGAGS